MFSTFYHGSLRKYVTLFGTLFNDLYINRIHPQSGEVSSIKVPLMYAPREKVLARLESDPNLNKPIATVLPRMSFEITTMTYSPTRKLPSVNRRAKTIDGASSLKYQYNPVPYDISFSLYIMVKNQEDGAQLLEQILPFFTPELTTTINVLPEMDVKLDVPLTLLNVTPQDTFEGNFEERRVIIWTLDFIMKGYFYGPVRETKVINLVDVNFFETTGFDSIESAVGQIVDPKDRINVMPGLDANGNPTSDASITIPRGEITANDNYGYIITNS